MSQQAGVGAHGAYATSYPRVTKLDTGDVALSGTIKPAITEVAITPNAGVASTVSGGVLRESNNSGTSTAYYYTAEGWPVVMNTDLCYSEIVNGALSTSTRGNGPGLMNPAGTKIVFVSVRGNTVNAQIMTFDGTTMTPRGTAAAVFATTSSDKLRLVPSLSGADIVWTLYKNGSATAVTWTDTGAAFGFPGRVPCGVLIHQYSGGHFGSPGIKGYRAADI